jgi:cyanophycinase-like exopeptidase
MRKIATTGLLVALLALLTVSSAGAQQALPQPREGEGAFASIGGGYSTASFSGWLSYAITNSLDTEIRSVVLTAAFGIDPIVITPEERAQLTADAQVRADQLQAVCQSLITGGQTCVTVLAPIFIQADAQDPLALDYFAGSVDAVFMLGGDNTLGMQVLANTPVETKLAELQTGGTLMASTSAGSAMGSKTMISGYVAGNGPENGLENNTINIWNDFSEGSFNRGLNYGVDNAVVEQFMFQQTRLARLLNVLAQPDVTPKIGIGVDGLTGVFIKDRTTVSETFGDYTTTILDAETFGSASGAQFINNILSIHDVLVHILAPGTSAYDLTTKQVSLNAVPVVVPAYEPRSFDTLKLPEGAGALILAGNLEANLVANPVLTRFVELSGGVSANILIVADGYTDDVAAQAAADAYAAAMGVTNTIIVVDNPAVPAVGEFSGVLLIGQDKSLIIPDSVATVIGNRWQDGTPVLADNAMSAILGKWYTNHAPTDIGGPNEEADVQESMLVGGTAIAVGLGWVDASFEPTMLLDKRLGRWFSLAYNNPETLAIGLTDDTALELNPNRTKVIGANGIMLLDTRRATLALGTNNAFVIANALLDTYAPGETLPVNLLLNGGFDGEELEGKLPIDWKAKDITQDKVKTDKPDKDISVDGVKAFLFKGTAGESSRLSQKVVGTGLIAGDNLEFSSYVWTKNAAEDFILQLKVKYVDTAIPTSKVTLAVLPGSVAYTLYDETVALTGIPAKLKIQIRYRNPLATGKVYVDTVKLLVNPTADAAPAVSPIPLPIIPLP